MTKINFNGIIFFLLAFFIANNLNGQEKDRRNGPIVLVDKNCIDGKFCVEEKERFYKRADMPDISDLINSYNQNNYMQFIYGVCERRFPTGKAIIEKAGGKSAVDKWLFSKSSASQVLGGLGMVIHEVGHGLDKQTPENWYYVAKLKDGSDLDFTTPGMHGKKTYSNSPMFSMERSLLLADDENKKRPPAQSSKIKTSKEFGDGDFGSDKMFAETYLTGDPADDAFDSGDQGYNALMEEMNQYINSLAVAYYFKNEMKKEARVLAGSDYHAVLTFLWWNERYLKKIRTEHKDQYDYLLKNKVWSEFILTLWGRAWRYLYTDVEGMEPDTKFLNELVRQEDMLSEIQRIRTACGCEDPEEWDPDVITNVDEAVNEPVADGLVVNGKNIWLNISKTSKLSLAIYNVNGQKVATLFEGMLEKGRRQFVWNNSDQFVNGLYIVEVKSNEFKKVARLMKIE